MCVGLQMYESDENKEVREEDLASILEIMLGVEEVELSGLFAALGRSDTRKTTYGNTQCLFVLKNINKHTYIIDKCDIAIVYCLLHHLHFVGSSPPSLYNVADYKSSQFYLYRPRTVVIKLWFVYRWFYLKCPRLVHLWKINWGTLVFWFAQWCLVQTVCEPLVYSIDSDELNEWVNNLAMLKCFILPL